MKEYPILFSAPMILAILAGTKTQTRRIIKPQPTPDKRYGYGGLIWKPKVGETVGGMAGLFQTAIPYHSPFGRPGDHLWVRETCRAEQLPDGTNGVRYLADNHFQPIANTREAAEAWVKLYQYGKRRGATVPPIHAPRWTSRILLEKVDGRVEQLQSIAEADAVAEGIEKICDYPIFKLVMQVDEPIGTVPIYKNYLATEKSLQADPYDICATLGESGGDADSWAVASYKSLWQSLHGPDSWEANPWLWVEQFKVIQP